MSFAKKSVCIFLCVLFAAAVFSTKAGAITLDGTIGTIEWKGAEQTEIFHYGTNTNSDITFAFMRVLVDRNNKAVYLAFQVIQQTRDALKPGNIAVGIRLNMKSGANITCRISGTDEYDHSSYSVEKSIVIGANNDYMIEMRIGYLFGVPENPLLGLQFIDSYGGFSNYYSFPVTTTAVSTTAVSTTKVTTTAKPTTTKAVTTNKPTTTKQTVKQTTAQTTTDPAANGTTLLSGGDPAYTYTDTAVAGESEEILQTQTTGSHLPSGETGAGSEDEYTTGNDTGRNNGGIGTNKQIAAVAAAAILIGLAVYLCVIAAKRKPAPEPGPEKQEGEPNNREDDDDF